MKRKKGDLFFAFRLLTWAGILLTGCGNIKAPPPQETILFKPPTAAPPSTPPTRVLPTSTDPTHSEDCTNQLQFEKDITVPDGTGFKPGESIVKQWLVTNTGTCNWDERYTVNLVSGPDLGAPRSQRLFPARNGQQVILEMTFTAPEQPGSYTSTWQAFDPQGGRFGDPFFIEIRVTED